jgi:hypothetical protein
MTGRIVRKQEGYKLPEVGKVKIGMKSDKGYPMSLDYFIGYGKYKDLFTQAFGEKPQKIQIIFISDNPADSCSERYELRDSKGDIYARGDGELFDIWDIKTKAYKQFSIKEFPDLMYRAETKCNEGVEERKQTKWRVRLTLRFIIVKIPNVLGTWSLETGGELSSIGQIRDTFDFVQKRAGTVTRILFDLTVAKHKSQKPGDASSYPVISLIPNMTDSNLLLLGKMREQINFSQINYLDNGKLLQLQEAEQKQIPEKIEVAEVVETETKETLSK